MIAGSILPGRVRGEAGDSPMGENTRGPAARWPLARLLLMAFAFAFVLLLGFDELHPGRASAAVVSTGGTFSVVWFIAGDDNTADAFQVNVAGARITFHDAIQGAILENQELSTACSNVDPATIICDTAADPNLSGALSPAALIVSLGSADSFDPGSPGCDDGPFESKVSADDGASIFGTRAGDTISVGSGSSVHGCGGDDEIDAISRSQLFGDSGDDLIGAGYGSPPPPRNWIGDHNIAAGGPGNDQIYVGARSRAIGGGGGDILGDGPGHSVLAGGSGPDALVSGPGHDRLVGGRGPDHLFAGSRRKKTSFFGFKLLPTQADRLSCGPGRDRADAGHNSRLQHCEKRRWLPYTGSTR